MTELDLLHDALEGATGVPVLVSLMRVSGSAYRGPGARMVVHADGRTVGVISGGCLEKDVQSHADQARAAGAPKVVTYDLTRDDDKPWGLGMGCNARLEVLFEPCPRGAPEWMKQVRAAHARRETITLETAPGFTETLAPPLLLVICGEGADVAPLARLADSLGWPSRCLGKEARPGPLDARCAAIVMTHNYQRDLDLLDELLAGHAGYIGVLGPRSRTERLLADLTARGRAPARLERLHGPVGLDIGGETPEEIALSIAAEVRAVFSGRSGGSLAERRGPIHDR